MKKIELAIIGAQKAGTTSLNTYLAQHPNIYTHFTQEFPMFASLDDLKKGLEKNIRASVQQNILINPEKKYFVAKRVGLMYNKEMLLKLYELFPDCKIVLILRNPIDRAFSAFNYCRKNGMEPYKKFEEAIYIDDKSRFKGNLKFQRNCDYVFRSRYLNPVKNINLIFPPENIRIYLFEEIVKNLKQPLNEMASLLNLPEFEFDTNVKYNEGAAARSDLFSKSISPGKFALIKKIFPAEQRMKMKLFLKNLNSDKTKKEKVQLSEGTREHLIKIFKEEILELNSVLNISLDKYWSEFF